VIFKLIVLAVAAALSGPAPAPAPSHRAVVWAVGDGADGSDVARSMARRIAADDPDRFLYLGDVYPSGSLSDFARNYATVYGPLAPITAPTPGNHEWANRATGYYPYWRRVRGRRLRPWYAFELAGWEILSLNSEAAHGPGSPQLRWLSRQLSEPGTCRLAFWHRPRFSAGEVHGDSTDMAPFWQALRGHARLVANGHEHDLQRFRKRAGITQYVAGAGGGENLYGVHSDPRVAFERSDVTGALRLVLRPGRARMEFRSVDGRVLDASRARCERLG
jgi:hypothetical protein